MEAKEPAGAQEEGLATSGILAVNQLSFKLPPDLSVAVQRNNQSQYFQSQQYSPGSTAIVVMNTGASYVDWRRSYLVMTVRNDSSAATDGKVQSPVWFGPNGSACNLINRVLIQTRSGTVVERVDNANQLASARLYMEHDRTWTGSPCEVAAPSTPAEVEAKAGCAFVYGAQGGSSIASGNNDSIWLGAAPTPTTGPAIVGQIRRFCIPCGEFSPVFRNSQSLWPSQLCSGLRIELLLENANIALVAAGTSASLGYTIVDIRIEAECYTLSDLVLRSLNNMAASSALEVVSVTAHDTQSTRATSTINVESGKAVSRALGYLYRERPALGNLVTGTNVDKFSTIVQDSTTPYITQHQARVGSLYFPQQGLKNQGGGTLSAWRTCGQEMYMTSLQSLGKMGGGVGENCSTNLFQYLLARFNVYQSLERSNVIDQSGIPLSNSRLLAIQQTWSAAPDAATLIDLFLFYTVLIRVYISGSNIEI